MVFTRVRLVVTFSITTQVIIEFPGALIGWSARNIPTIITSREVVIAGRRKIIKMPPSCFDVFIILGWVFFLSDNHLSNLTKTVNSPPQDPWIGTLSNEDGDADGDGKQQ